MEKQTLTFADQEIANRLASRKHFLKDVDQLIDWKRINKLISKVEIRRTSVAGRDAYSAEVMFRIMLVQAWYKLSDYQMEEQLVYNNMFLWFCHLSMENPVPDHSTICCWRGRLSEKRIYEKLLQEINSQLSKHKIRITEGFKGHTVVDLTHGLVQAIQVTPANTYDGHMLISLVDSLGIPKETEVLADKGYCSQDNEEALQERNLVSKIMKKKKKNQDMPEETKVFNHSVSTQRYRIERSFGGLKKHFGWGRSIYMGLQKTADYLFMGANAFNLKRSLKILRA